MVSLRKQAGLPPAGELREQTLLAARELHRTATRTEIIDATAERLSLTEEQRSVSIPSGRTSVVNDRIGLELTNLKTVGALDNPAHGLWTVTETGETITFDDVERLLREVRNEQQHRRQTSRQTDDDDDEEEQQAGSGPGDANWCDQLLQRIHKLSPAGFERLTRELLICAGFDDDVKVTKASHDGGIDGVGTYRLADLITFRASFQCKRWKGAVGSPVVQQFRGALPEGIDRGIIITTGYFTKSAIKEAEQGRRIDLIDGERLCDLLRNHKIGVQTELVEEVTINAAHFDRFDEERS